MAASRFGIPAQVHEECLTGFAAWRATVYPTPLSWGATFDPELVEEMAGRIGRSMRAAGVHQGLAPVLDVTRDYRWGRTEETIGEDPYLVGTIGAAYVRGLERAGIVATLKHFAGYSASRGGRNLAPVSMGRRELADVDPAAVRDGPAARRRPVGDELLRRDRRPARRRRRGAADRPAARRSGASPAPWSPTTSPSGSCRPCTVSRRTPADAAELALRAGHRRRAAHRGHLRRAAGRRGPRRRRRRGAYRPGAAPGADPEDRARPARRGLAADARRRRRSSASTTRSAGTSPLRLAREVGGAAAQRRRPAAAPPVSRVALVGPVADDPMALLGCYSFPNHVGVTTQRPGLGRGDPDAARRAGPAGPACSTARAGLRRHRRGHRRASPAAVAAAAGADVCVLAVGDRAGMFGRGTSGEGCDAADLRLPGVQAELVRGGARHRHPGRAGADDRPAVRARPGVRRGGGRRPGVLPRPARRAGARRGAHRRGEPVRAAAGQRARATPAACPAPTCRRRSGTAPRCRRSTRPRPSRSATG